MKLPEELKRIQRLSEQEISQGTSFTFFSHSHMTSLLRTENWKNKNISNSSRFLKYNDLDEENCSFPLLFYHNSKDLGKHFWPEINCGPTGV